MIIIIYTTLGRSPLDE